MKQSVINRHSSRSRHPEQGEGSLSGSFITEILRLRLRMTQYIDRHLHTRTTKHLRALSHPRTLATLHPRQALAAVLSLLVLLTPILPLPTFGAGARTNDPIAQWKFDEGYGTAAHDSSANGANATFSGTTKPTWQTSDLCVSGKCVYLSGNNSYLTTTPNAALTTSFTFVGWIRRTSGSAFQTIYQSGTSTNFWKISIDGSNHLDFTKNSLADYPATQTVPLNTWTYVTVVKDGDSGSNITFYVNGSPAGTASAGSVDTPSGTAYIGTANANSEYVPGFLDELKVYNYARSQAQIQADFNAANTPQGATAIGVNSQKFLSDGLVGYWRMDEGSWNGTSGEVKDASGNSNAGTAAGGATTGAGKFGNGASLNGAGDVAMPSGSSTTLNMTSDLTLATWIKTTSDNVGIISFGDNYSGASGYLLGIGLAGQGAGKLVFNASSNWMASTKTINDGQWHHIAVTMKNKQVSFYIDGSLDTTTTSSTNPASWSGDRAIAGRDDSSDNFLVGSLDETRVYNRALSATESQQLYNFAPGPVGQWNFEEGSGNTVNDTSGYGNTGAWSGTGNHWTAGKVGKAGQFNGASDYVATANNTTFDANGSYITAEAWVKPTSATSTMVLSKGGTGGGWFIQAVMAGGNNQLLALYKSNSSSGVSRVSSGLALHMNEWNHIAVEIKADTITQANNDIQIYINGALNQGSLAQAALPTLSTDKLKIGARGLDASPQDFFGGQIDNAKIYNYARTQSQILQDMNGGKPAVDSPVGYWKFDEGYGTTAHNSGIGGSALDGTLTNMASPATPTSGWTNGGKYGKALSFDGADDYVNIANYTSLSPGTGDFSISSWFQTTTAGDIINTSNNNAISFTQGYGLIVASTSWGPCAYKLVFNMANGTNRDSSLCSAQTVNDGEWHHVVVSIQRGNVIKLFVDGKLSSSIATSLTGGISNAHGFIGRGTWTSYFSGQIDDAQIYNYALSAQEVALDYNHSSSAVLGASSTNSDGKTASLGADRSYCVPGDTSTCSPPVGEWKFEEGTGTTLDDSSGNGNTCNLSGSSMTPNWITGKYGKAWNFSNNNTYYFNCGNGSTVNFGTGDFTMEAWFYGNSFPSTAWQRIMGKVNWGSPWYGVDFGIYWQRLKASINSPQGNTSVTAPNLFTSSDANIWHHAAFVANRQSGLYLYLDGKLIASTLTATNTFDSTVTDPFEIGGEDHHAPSYTFPGRIDGAKVYNYARTPAQVAWDYNQGKPVAEYKMDECSGTTIHSSTSPYDATLNGTLNIGASGTQTAAGTCTTSGTAWGNGASGKINGSLSFDGVDDYADISDSAGLQMTSNISVSLWINPTNLIGQKVNYPISKGTGGGPSQGWAFGVNGSYTSGCTSVGQIYLYTNNTFVCSSATVKTGVWSHIVFTNDGTTTKEYLNGVLVGSGMQTIQANNGADLNIGRRSDAIWYFNGKIDDVQIYNYALAPVQVQTLYNQGAARFGG